MRTKICVATLQCPTFQTTSWPTRLVQGQAAQFLKPDDPFPYLGVHITMDLNWSHQLTHMTTKLSFKTRTTTTSFPVTPCSLSVLNQWDTQILAAIKSKYKLWMCTSTAQLIFPPQFEDGPACLRTFMNRPDIFGVASFVAKCLALFPWCIFLAFFGLVTGYFPSFRSDSHQRHI